MKSARKYLDSTKFELSVATMSDAGRQLFAHGWLLLVSSKDHSRKEEKLDYGRLVLERHVLDIKTGMSLITSLIAQDNANLPSPLNNFSFSPTSNPNSVRTLHSGQNHPTYKPWWPTRLLSFNCAGEQRANPVYRPLVRKQLPLYPTEGDAIQTFFNMPIVEYPNFGSYGEFSIFIPDYRARISEMRIGEKSISIKVETQELRPDDVRVKVYVSSSSESKQSHDLTVAIERAEYPIDIEPNRVLSALVESNSGDEIDVKEWNSNYAGYRTPDVIVERTGEQIKDLISRGESKTLEFKANINNERKEEFLETVIAFSNSKGGLILLGVENHGIPVGFSGDTESIRRMIRDSCEPLIEPFFTSYTVDNNRITAVEIREGTNKPYLLKHKGTSFVRIGPNDFPAARADLDELYAGRNQPFSPGLRNF